MMMTALALMFAMVDGPTLPSVVENIEPSSPEISIQLFARIPHLTARQEDALDALVEALPRAVDGYGPRDMIGITNGDAIRCLAGPDYVWIGFHVPRNGLQSGLGLMEALARRSHLEAGEGNHDTPQSAWTWALRPYRRTRAPRPAEVQALYQTLFRPQNLTLGVGGPLTPGQATADWQGKMATWAPPRVDPPGPYEPDPKVLTKNPGGLDAIEIAGPVFDPKDAALPQRSLALFALGSGKGSSIFRIGRQKLGLSYRQEAMLYPVEKGWQPRILAVMKPTGDAPGKAEQLRTALLEDVGQWTDADRIRALGIADAVLNRGVPFSPFAFGPFGTFDANLEGRTFLNTYWQMKTGEPWDAYAFQNALQKVSLEDLRRAAAEILSKGALRVLPAN